MDKIREISPNNYALLCNGKWQSGFYKIEKVAENSHYYCLWPVPEYFYLYHIDKERYAINSNMTSGANKFSKIEHYSEETGSFVAYREDEDFAHIIFEDGYVESTTFSLVGEEKEGTRTVKTCNDRWYFYNVKKKQFLHLTGSKGYAIDGHLENILTYNIFVVSKNKKGKQLILYNRGKAPVYSRDHFDTIELINKSSFIGKLYNRNIYCIIKGGNIAYPIGYYTGLPKYVKEHNLFIAAKGDSYCIVKGEKEIQNHQWKSDSFIFQCDYILNKQENSSCWKIFSANDGHEIPTDFKNIQILDDQALYLSAEVKGRPEQKFSIKDIDNISKGYIHGLLTESNSQELLIKFKEKTRNSKEIHIPKTDNSFEADSNIPKGIKNCNEENVNFKNNTKDTPMVSNKPKLPACVNFYTFTTYATIINNRITNGRIDCETFRGPTFVAWFIHENHTLIITESRRTKVHSVLYIKKESPLVRKLFEHTHFWKYKQLYQINCALNRKDENVLEESLSQSISKLQHLKTEIDLKHTSKESTKKKEKPQISKIKDTMPIEQETNANDQRFAEFLFGDTSYKLKLDNVWDVEDIFNKKRVQHRLVGNIVYILYDITTDKAIKSKNGQVHYHIYGEGKDKRFDQYFGHNSNKLLRDCINDTNKRILLFKKNAKNKILFQDEVKCVEYYTTLEEDSNRTVIIFKLMSLLRYPFIEKTTLNESEKEQTIVETKEINNKEEINKLSNHTNISKLQELYETREKLLSLGIAPNTDLEKQLAALEEESIQNEIVPIITQTIEPVLKSVKRKVVLVVEYDPEEGVQVHLSQKNPK